MPCAFERNARHVYEEVAESHVDASADDLWEILETSLCNMTHRSALQDKILGMKRNDRKESVAHYAERLRSAEMALPTTSSMDVLLNCFKAGLPQKLQDQAVLVTGEFDTVVSSVSRLSAAQPSIHRESVRYTAETPDTTQNTASRGSSTDRFAHFKCHACQQMGHIARHCLKTRGEKENTDNAGSTMGGKTGKEKGARNPQQKTKYSR